LIRPGALTTGAEALSLLLAGAGTEIAFAYAGTSELALCTAFSCSPAIRLVNSRGDKEAAFMAAGASVLQPGRGVAVLHGARGLTNALGAIGVARRNEVGVICLVGLPSTTSARFLPPHGEADLIASAGRFAKWHYEAAAVPAGFVEAVRRAICEARTRPLGPVLLGVPQDVAETAWLPGSALSEIMDEPHPPAADGADVAAASSLLRQNRPVVIIVDDYLLRYEGVRPILTEFSARLGARVFQVRYRRGPMLFERLRRTEVPTFEGWLDPTDPGHRAVLESAALLVTLEDRNLYRRVVGDLPRRPKLAITSDAGKVLKNEYLGEGDVLLEGDVAALLARLNGELRHLPAAVPPPLRAAARPEPAPAAARRLREGIARAVGEALAGIDEPVLVDDSQMFGGLLAQHYDLLPAGTRVIGDHAGFVGGGIATATGLALSEPGRRVFCCLGDQAFTNGLQGLVSAVQESAPVVFVVCNNGMSVSLLEQAAASGSVPDGSYLQNPPGFDYTRVARALGVRSESVSFPTGAGAEALRRFRTALRSAAAGPGPALVEARLPGSGPLWESIWAITGLDGK
jgi:acetolactate synthase I/II/III large subunit